MVYSEDSLYIQFLHWKAMQADDGIIDSTTNEEWIKMKRKKK